MKQELVTPQVKRLIDETLAYNDSLEEVKLLIDAQCEKGLKEYGVPLMTNNGLSAKEEACKELVDFIQYSVQQSMEYKESGNLVLWKRWRHSAKIALDLLSDLILYG